MNKSELDKQERIVIYSIIFTLFVLLLLLLLCVTNKSPFPPIATNETDAAKRIFDGVGFEGLSAIFAIVISLSLMAVQFASQQYTHRIMKIHINSLIFRFVIVIYLGSMLYNLIMLGCLDLDNSKNSGGYVVISMLLTCLSLFILIPYFYFTMYRLRPDAVINKLLVEIDEDYLNSIKGFFEEGESRRLGTTDKLLPITDTIEKSISSGDRETARFGIDKIYGCYASLLKEENDAHVSPYFQKHILRIGREAIIEADDDSLAHVLEIFGKVGTRAIRENLNVGVRMSVESIDIISSKILDNDVATRQMIDSLQDMLKAIINSGNEEILGQIFTLYHNTSDELCTLKDYQMLKYMGNSFSELLDSMMKKKCYDLIVRTGGLLERIGIFAVNIDIRDVLHQSIHSLYKIGISSAKDNLVWETHKPKRKVIIAERIIDHLLKIEEEALKYKSKLKEFDSIINEIEFARKDIEKYREEEEEEVDFSDLWR